MVNKIGILITDDNIEFCNLLNGCLGKEPDMNVLGVAKDGIQALEMIPILEPDVVVLDIIMPNLDGIGVLERLSTINLKKKPLFIILSAIGQDIFIQKAIALGAEYYIVKPFSVDILISRIRQIYSERFSDLIVRNNILPKAAQVQDKKNPQLFDLEVEVTNLIRDVGIPPHMLGYQYLREAIMHTVVNDRMFGSVTRILYPSVATKFKTTPQKVERSIRNAIESAWDRGNPDSIDSLFGYTINYSKGKPTNSEFIAMMADKIRVNLGMNKN